MRIAFILESVGISGGIYVIFEHASRMQAAGHDVFILSEQQHSPSEASWHTSASNLGFKTFEEVREICFDVVIATWWRTVYSLPKAKANVYMYFVQSIESKFYNESELALRKLVDSTYLLDLPIITEATWIKEYLENSYDCKVELVHNGIRKDLYNLEIVPKEKKDEKKLRVLIEGPINVDFKNVVKTIEICQKSEADELWLLTSSPLSSYPGIDRVFSQIPIDEVGSVYSSCDVIVKLSYVEGMFGPPLEMFHCGGTAIVYDVSGHDEYIEHNINGFVTKTDDDEQVVEYINLLKHDKDTMLSLIENAKTTAANWPDWETSSTQFLDKVVMLHDSYKKLDNRREDIKEKTTAYNAVYENSQRDLRSSIENNFYDFKMYIKTKFPRFFFKLKQIKDFLKR